MKSILRPRCQCGRYCDPQCGLRLSGGERGPKLKAALIITLCCLTGSTWAAQRQTNLSVSATIVEVACPPGVTALSCAPFSQTTAVADSYDVASPAVDGGIPPTIQKVQGRLNIVTITY
ncbi:MAG: hypothetical protein JF606_21895 [Burkholderiales bacterium]|nr:hypothetical protein [Burkholderiales bacterium]